MNACLLIVCFVKRLVCHDAHYSERRGLLLQQLAHQIICVVCKHIPIYIYIYIYIFMYKNNYVCIIGPQSDWVYH